MAVTTNLTYSLLLIFQLIPYTVLIIGILFGDSRARDYPTFTYAVFVFLTTHAVMYTYEGIARGIVKVSTVAMSHLLGPCLTIQLLC